MNSMSYVNDEKLVELTKQYADRDLLEELSWEAYANHNKYLSKPQAEFINWLCYAAYKELKAQQWIPVSKKLPKEADEYQITIKDRHGDTYVKKTMYFPDDELWWDISPFETVTAWMPVPEPYREL